eukprot:scaffold1581_cov169-Amphora_coffeaeformis.AAC.4
MSAYAACKTTQASIKLEVTLSGTDADAVLDPGQRNDSPTDVTIIISWDGVVSPVYPFRSR